jgi:hypothetical protein
MKYKIYKLIHNSVVVYVGRTTLELGRRKAGGYSNNASIQAIYKECEIELIEETNDVSRERYWIENYKDTLLNIKRGDTGLYREEYRKEWEEANKEHRKEQMKEYYEVNKEKKKEYDRERYQKIKNKNLNNIFIV